MIASHATNNIIINLSVSLSLIWFVHFVLAGVNYLLCPFGFFLATLITGRSSHYYHPAFRQCQAADNTLSAGFHLSISGLGGRGGLEKELCHLKT